MGRAPRPRLRRGGGGGGAWLDGDAAEAVACDAAMVPFVTGDVNPGALEDLVRLCVQLDRLRHHPRGSAATTAAAATATAAPAAPAATAPAAARPRRPRTPPGRGRPSSGRSSARRWTCCRVRAGWRSFLRRRQLGARLGGPSLPLDIGFSQSIPAGIRNAVTLRDQHCQWAGRCNQPASACEVHHVRHKKNGGKTSTKDCVLLCFFHHQIVIHKWGWTLVLNPDGTTTAWNPDKTKVLHSHSPPASPGDAPA